jgi:glycosyltransferase involved in cell wall biosynthesis
VSEEVFSHIMKITVILCSYNRCQSLAKALESLALSTLPPFVEWDVLVVDNNSHDETRLVVEEYCQRFPQRFRYMFEPRQGKSHALNSGIREARADVLVFMDDDVEVDRNWLYNLTSSLKDSQWSGAGGRILPEAGFALPSWLETKDRYSLAPLAIFDLGTEPGELREAPFGTNMAFRMEMFSKYGNFRTDLGPQPGSEIRNEDTDFGSRLLAGGERLWYEPSAVVYHAVPQNRVQQSYFLAWWFDKARADIRQSGMPEGTSYHVAGVPIYLFRRLGAWTLRWIIAMNPGRRFSCKLKVWGIAGMIEECHRFFAESAKTTSVPEAKVVPTPPTTRQ